MTETLANGPDHFAASLQGLGGHDESPALAGFSEAGRAAAKASAVAYGLGDPLDAVDGWMATLYHRVPLLDPNLKRVGFGCRPGADSRWVSVLDVGRGRVASAHAGS